MARMLSEGAALFLLPFAFYAVFLVLGTRLSFVRHAWSNGALARLSLAGLSLAVLGLLVLGLVSERHTGAYRPAHIENGRLIPGHMD